MEDYLVARKRPTGVSILAFLAILGAVVITIISALAIFAVIQGDDRVRQASEAMAQIGIPPYFMAAGILFLLALGWASGIGMWIGAKWGWHLGAFWYAYAIARNIGALLTIYGSAEMFEAEMSSSSSRGPEYYYIKHSGRLLISFLIYLYFFKDNVREYFGLENASKWNAVAAHFGICAALFIVGTAISVALT